MTLDDETAANIAREVIGGGKADRVYPHSTDVALVRAGYAARDAEVEELRSELARRDDAVATVVAAWGRSSARGLATALDRLAEACVEVVPDDRA